MKTTREDDSIPPPRMGLVVLIICILALASLISQLTYIAPEDQGKIRLRFFIISSTVTYENMNGEGNSWEFTEEYRAVGLFMNNSWQTVYLANISHPIERYEVDADGNAVGLMSFFKPRIDPGKNFTYRVEYGVVFEPRSIPEISEGESKTLADVPGDLKGLHCRAEGPWLVNESDIRDLALRIAGNETIALTVVKKFVAWIRDNIEYESSDISKYPNETLLEKAGDCDDQANLLITFCRIVGIPAYLQVGCIYLPSRYTDTSHYWNDSLMIILNRVAWHGWAMVYVPPWGWLPVDLTYVSRISLQVDPLNAIKLSAVIAHPTVQYANITRTNYVAAARDQRDFLLANGFSIIEHDIMEEQIVEEETVGAAAYRQPFEVILLAPSRLSLRSWRILINGNFFQ